jgi:hypothetical protein
MITLLGLPIDDDTVDEMDEVEKRSKRKRYSSGPELYQA